MQSYLLIFVGNADLGVRFGLPLKSIPARASSIAVGHIATPVIDCRRPVIQGNLRTPSALTSSSHMSNKCSPIDSSLKSVSSDQSQFADLAKSAQTIKLASIKMKRQRMEHEMVQAHQKMEHARRTDLLLRNRHSHSSNNRRRRSSYSSTNCKRRSLHTGNARFNLRSSLLN